MIRNSLYNLLRIDNGHFEVIRIYLYRCRQCTVIDSIGMKTTAR